MLTWTESCLASHALQVDEADKLLWNDSVAECTCSRQRVSKGNEYTYEVFN